MAAVVAFSVVSMAVTPATAGLSAALGANGPGAGGSESVFMYRSLLYGSLNPSFGRYFSTRWNCRRESDDPITINSPACVETSAGRLSRILSLCARNTGPVHVLPSNDTTFSDHTVPSGFHQIGCALR